MAQRKTGELIWLALQYAVQDRITLADAYGNDEDEQAVKDARAEIRAFRRLQKKLFGTDRSKLDNAIAKLQPRDIFKMLADGIDDAEHSVEPTVDGLGEKPAEDNQSESESPA